MSAKMARTSPSHLMAPMEIREPPTISSPTKRLPSRRQLGGFTLIEILIVLGIISMVMAMGLPAIERVTYQRVNSTTRKFIGLVRTIRNDSILLNLVQRLAID